MWKCKICRKISHSNNAPYAGFTRQNFDTKTVKQAEEENEWSQKAQLFKYVSIVWEKTLLRYEMMLKNIKFSSSYLLEFERGESLNLNAEKSELASDSPEL